jgi:predicted metal-dependent phosphoesterase TrpH
MTTKKKSKEKTGYRIDMHVHTRGSDGVSSAEEIARAAVAAGLDGICITDHHHTYTPEGVEVAVACRAVGLRVYHGCEYTTAEGHCLVYGVDVDQLNFGRYPAMQDVIDRVDAVEGIAIPAHPYHGYKTLLGDKVRALKNLIAVEGLNGQVEVQAAAQNQHAMQMAWEEGLMVLGGSDAHFAQ